MRYTTVSLPGMIGLTLLATAIGQAKQTPVTASDVTVCLHNTIVATPGSIERAKQVAKNMFSSIGVNLRWHTDSDVQQGLIIDVVMTSGEPGDDEFGPLAEAYPFSGSMGHITVRYDRVHASAGISRDL